MTDFAGVKAEQFPTQERTPREWFNELQGRVEHILESRSSTPDNVSIEVFDDLNRPSWMGISLRVEQLRGLKTTVANVTLGARWGSTEGSADKADISVSRSRIESPADQARNLGCLALLDICVSAAEAAVV